jgi:hypothetical protein
MVKVALGRNEVILALDDRSVGDRGLEPRPQLVGTGFQITLLPFSWNRSRPCSRSFQNFECDLPHGILKRLS